MDFHRVCGKDSVIWDALQHLEFHRLINMELFFVCYRMSVLSSKLLNTERTEESYGRSFNTKITRVINNLYSYLRRVGIDIFQEISSIIEFNEQTALLNIDLTRYWI